MHKYQHNQKIGQILQRTLTFFAFTVKDLMIYFIEPIPGECSEQESLQLKNITENIKYTPGDIMAMPEYQTCAHKPEGWSV